MPNQEEQAYPGERATADSTTVPLQFARKTEAAFGFDTPLEVVFIRESEVDYLLRIRFRESLGLVLGSLGVAVGLADIPNIGDGIQTGLWVLGGLGQIASILYGEILIRSHKQKLPEIPGGKRVVFRHRPDTTRQSVGTRSPLNP